MPFNLRECVDGAVALIRSLAAEKGLVLRPRSTAVPAVVMGDVSRLRQILLNLLNNAIKFTEAGSVILSVTAEAPRMTTSFDLHVSVVGHRYRASRRSRWGGCSSRSARRTPPPAGNTAAPGSGSRSPNGWPRRWAAPCGPESEGLGLGSTFHLTIATRAAEDQTVSQSGQGGAALDLDPGHAERHPLRILLAEDNVVNQKLAIRLLGRMGYQADVAGNGLEAIEAIERQRYDLVLMDVQMPEMDGIEATENIIQRVPPAAAVDRRHDRKRNGRRPRSCIAAGMNGYVSKPIRVEELVAAVLGRPPEPVSVE